MERQRALPYFVYDDQFQMFSALKLSKTSLKLLFAQNLFFQIDIKTLNLVCKKLLLHHKTLLLMLLRIKIFVLHVAQCHKV